MMAQKESRRWRREYFECRHACFESRTPSLAESSRDRQTFNGNLGRYEHRIEIKYVTMVRVIDDKMREQSCTWASVFALVSKQPQIMSILSVISLHGKVWTVPVTGSV